MAIRTAHLTDKNTGEVVNVIVIDNEKVYAPDNKNLVVTFAKDALEETVLNSNFNIYVKGK